MAGIPIVVADAVMSLASQAVTRRRFAAGAYSTTAGSKGVFVPGTGTDSTISVCIGPIDDRTRMLLPEGIRLHARYLMHTLADVRGDQPTVSGTSITQADAIIYNSRTYQVFQDRRWVDHGQYRRFVLVEQTAEP